MSIPIRLRRLAQAEFDDAIDWYKARGLGLGAAFERAVQRVFDAITATPDTYPVVYDDVREAPVIGYRMRFSTGLTGRVSK